jgi:hypothetical protein
MKKMNLKYGLVALVGLGFSANVSAADFTCSDITFTPEAYASYEFADKACLDIVDRDGGTFAKMTARIVAQTASGAHIRFRHADGELGPSHKSNLPEDFRTLLRGRSIKMKDLAVSQEVNIYVSNAYWATPVAAEVVEEVVEAAPPPPPPPPAPEPEWEPEPEPEMLPTTASVLPWLALFGSLFLVLGGALRFSRK